MGLDHVASEGEQVDARDEADALEVRRLRRPVVHNQAAGTARLPVTLD